MKILIADDSLLDRKLLINLLKKSGVQNDILQASNGEEALAALSSNLKDICLIILDWQMPKVDGIGFMKTIVPIPELSDIPIVMITASSSEENKKLAKDTNPKLAGYLVKPYSTEKLIETITPFLK